MLSPHPTHDIAGIGAAASRTAGSNHKAPFRAARRISPGVIVFAAVLSAAGLVFFLPVRFPSAVNTYASIAPAQRWILAKGVDGQLIACTFNYETGMSEGYRVSNFNAGTSIFFSVSPSLAPGKHVEVGDTVGTIYSTEMQERLATLNGELAAAERLLDVTATGQKAAIINGANQQLRSAQRRREEYQKTVTRTETLFAAHLISQVDYDSVQSTAHVLDDEIAMAQAYLETAGTGEKPEQVALVESNIAALKNEINAINSRAATYTLIAPIAGIVSPTFSGDTLLTISTTSQYVALIPLRWSDYPRVAATPNAPVSIGGLSRPVRGRLIALNQEVQMLYSQNVVMATALLNSAPDDLLLGSLVRCRIACSPLTALEYAKLVFRSAATPAEAFGGY